jgi:hypothetical protein
MLSEGITICFKDKRGTVHETREEAVASNSAITNREKLAEWYVEGRNRLYDQNDDFVHGEVAVDWLIRHKEELIKLLSNI